MQGLFFLKNLCILFNNVLQYKLRKILRTIEMIKRNLTLLTDLYQLTMMNGYLKHNKHNDIVIFDVFFRQNELITYSISAGLEQAVDYVLNLKFDKEEIDYLRSLNLFKSSGKRHIKLLSFPIILFFALATIMLNISFTSFQLFILFCYWYFS